MSITAIDPNGTAWQDYRSVVIEGQKPSAVAKAQGKSPSTVSRNVATIKGYLDAGVPAPENVEGLDLTLPTSPDAITIETAATDLYPVTGAGLIATRGRLEREKDRLQEQVERLSDQLVKADEALATWDTSANEEVGFDMGAVRDRLAAMRTEAAEKVRLQAEEATKAEAPDAPKPDADKAPDADAPKE